MIPVTLMKILRHGDIKCLPPSHKARKNGDINQSGKVCLENLCFSYLAMPTSVHIIY